MEPVTGLDVGAELRTVADNKPILEREMRLAQVVTTMKMAARGDLHPEGEDIGPIRGHPMLFELRWNFGREIYRLVHAEPPRLPDHLIGLRFHQKSLVGSKKDIQDAQDGEVATAKLRYMAGDSSDWGVA
jgi:hypothetical protein